MRDFDRDRDGRNVNGIYGRNESSQGRDWRGQRDEPSSWRSGSSESTWSTRPRYGHGEMDRGMYGGRGWEADRGSHGYGHGRGIGGSYGRDYGRDYGSREHERDFTGGREHGQRDYGQRDFGQREYGQRDYGQRDYGQRDYGQRDYGRDYGSRDYGQQAYGYGRDGGQRDWDPREMGRHGQGGGWEGREHDEPGLWDRMKGEMREGWERLRGQESGERMYGRHERHGWGERREPGFWEQTKREMREGWDRVKESFAGKGPKGYARPDERIREDVCDRLAMHPEIDASEIEVTVSGGEVTLAGTVHDRRSKRLAEDVVEDIFGVKDVANHLRVNRGTMTASASTSGAMTGAGTSGTGLASMSGTATGVGAGGTESTTGAEANGNRSGQTAQNHRTNITR